MRLGIMQPYFFPYPGHFALIAHIDQWLVFDITQYTHKSWMSRNRILHPQRGMNYVSVALANASIAVRTHEVRILDLPGTRQTVLGKLSHYRSSAPYYPQVIALVARAFEGLADDRLVSLNTASLEVVCDYLGLPFEYRICSKLNLELPDNLTAGLWAPTLSAQLGATEYLNPIGGHHLFHQDDFAAHGVQLKLLDFAPLEYKTGPYLFEPHLSILDALMWLSPEHIRKALHTHSQIVDGFPLSGTR
jgi:hypothetical protein